ncbi:MAG: hypothetical protein IKB90_01830 [Alistipes sp.]|nr:hypothetical protein [Alistipes sp.]
MAVVFGAMMAATLLSACGTKLVEGDTPLKVESESAEFVNNFKLLSWNIQDGMWCDQFDDYVNFVAYINEINPDVFCIQEAASHWDIDGKNLSHYSRYLPYPDQKNVESKWDNPSGWVALAKRWGHEYVVMGPYKDNYPVVITSKYPIEIIERLRGDENTTVSHGALYAKVHFTDDISVNLVNLHLQPDNIANASNFRMNEINFYLSKTINSKEHYRDEHWLMMGDFNSNVGKNVDVEVRKNSYYDLWAEMNSYNKSYIDFIYGTESMRKSLKSIDFLYGFAHMDKIMYSPNGVAINNGVGVWRYSDHYPVLAEFSLYE